jgi:hypothetical protein
MTGLLELIGLILLFGAAPICLWKLWVRIDCEPAMAAPAPMASAASAASGASGAEAQPVTYFYDYEQLAS